MPKQQITYLIFLFQSHKVSSEVRAILHWNVRNAQQLQLVINYADCPHVIMRSRDQFPILFRVLYLWLNTLDVISRLITLMSPLLMRRTTKLMQLNKLLLTSRTKRSMLWQFDLKLYWRYSHPRTSLKNSSFYYGDSDISKRHCTAQRRPLMVYHLT